MFTWGQLVSAEQHRNDLLREAERERQAKAVRRGANRGILQRLTGRPASPGDCGE
jgi:hypothetical protein